jgi:hypothetical protein
MLKTYKSIIVSLLFEYQNRIFRRKSIKTGYLLFKYCCFGTCEKSQYLSLDLPVLLFIEDPRISMIEPSSALVHTHATPTNT